MKKLFLLLSFVFVLSFTAAAQQEMNSKGEPVKRIKDNAPVELKSGEKITRGMVLTKDAKKVSLEAALKNPEKYAGQNVAVEGVIVRSCKKEGCWMEMGTKEGKKSVRVAFGDHAFFIPLNAAGLDVKAEGTFQTKVLSKAEVDHLIKDDGAKFDNRNADGSVTEVSFNAKGVEMWKATK